MKVALVDNGSLEAAAHLALRAAAAAIGTQAGVPVEAVSWKHSSRVPADLLGGVPAPTLTPWVRAQVAAGEREFLFVPFFVSPQGAIGSALRADLEMLQGEAGGFDFCFAAGLAAGTLATVLADRVRSLAATLGLAGPAVVVDHGGPAAASAAVRDAVAAAVRQALGGSVASVRAASMESPAGPGFAFNRPLLAEALAEPGLADVLIAPLFLSPGRHAGPEGDLAAIARAAAARAPGLRCHFTGLVGSHPAALDSLSRALTQALQVGAHS